MGGETWLVPILCAPTMRFVRDPGLCVVEVELVGGSMIQRWPRGLSLARRFVTASRDTSSTEL